MPSRKGPNDMLVDEFSPVYNVSDAVATVRAARPFPAPLSPASAILPSLRSGTVSLDEAEHFLHNRLPAPLRSEWCSRSSRESAVGFVPRGPKSIYRKARK